MNATDLRVLRTLAEMARGVDLRTSLVDQTPPETADSATGPPDRRKQLLSRTLHFDSKIPDLLLRLELQDIEDALRGALIALLGRGFITSGSGELVLPVGSYVFITSDGRFYSIGVQRLNKSLRVGRLKIIVCSEMADDILETVSRMPWYAVTPRGWGAAEQPKKDAPKTQTRPRNDPEPVSKDADRRKDLTPPGEKENKNVGGRPAVSKAEARRRTALVQRWKRAKASGVRQKDFCNDNDVSLKHLTKCVNWDGQRRRRSNDP